ncbi:MULTISPECIES: DUF6460 domain-containing protein [Kordiimonas]|jgi:hypothetical protein|uniref:DUF6460 domain-containing protein n=1 Tax=Kordiimonas lacus TaxID=637679 RepID=A0A1G6T6S4_9PROT|nr:MULTISPECIES: DUF6460 domain-containing protein [Kordiimonas]SDD24673.1 hypothetical protein SAMN04488071_0134 [Kordiimonas lacus]
MQLNAGVIIKLAVWSFLVGLLLYWLEWSPGDVYGWLANKIATLWDWLVGSGLQYVLLGATIVVPVYLIMQFKNRRRRG